MERFELTPEEREELVAFVNNPPNSFATFDELSQCITKITARVKPFYEAGQGMAENDLVLIDKATEVLAYVDDIISKTTTKVELVKENLTVLHRGNDTVH
jgi:hypothetical protein